MVSASRGVPTTVAASSNSTVATIVSPAMKVPIAPRASPETVTPETRGPVTSDPLPATVKPAAALTACVPRPSAALLLPASRIVPEFSPSAAAPMLIPSASVSPATTV